MTNNHRLQYRNLIFIAQVLLFIGLSVSLCFAQSLNGTITSHNFIGHLTQSTVFYNIYLPEGYASSTERYPVIYHLHGLGNYQGGSQNTIIPEPFELAKDTGIIGPVIIVFPNGYNYSFWADSSDSTKPAQTNVIYELIPHIDSTYRTIAQRKYRIVQGWSMGGCGAALYFTKFPNLFNAAVLYDAALLPWSTLTTVFPDTARAIFGNNESYFNQFSPWVFASVNSTLLQRSTSIRMVVAVISTYNRDYYSYLTSLNIHPTYIETTCQHILSNVIDVEGLNSVAFIANVFNTPTTTAVDEFWRLYSFQETRGKPANIYSNIYIMRFHHADSIN